MKTLLVLRHAKSSRDDPRLADHKRPLNERGRRDAPQMGNVLRERALTPEIIISSDAVRARETAEAAARTAGFTGKIRFDPRLYNASPADILDVLQTMVKPEPRSVMIVGHNPGLEELVNQLTGESPDLPTAALAEIHLPIDGWRDLHGSIRGVLANLWRPKELP